MNLSSVREKAKAYHYADNPEEKSYNITMPMRYSRTDSHGLEGGSMFENYRRYQRYSISAKAVVRTLTAESQDGLTAQVNTISQGGTGFYTNVFMEKATPVSIEFFFGCLQGMEDILVGKIASVCTHGKDYFVGVSFEREIPYEHFMELIG
jgi:hypothetical protein